MEASGAQRRVGSPGPGTGSKGEQVDREARAKPCELGWKVRHWAPWFLATAAEETAVNYSPVTLGQPTRLPPVTSDSA